VEGQEQRALSLFQVFAQSRSYLQSACVLPHFLADSDGFYAADFLLKQGLELGVCCDVELVQEPVYGLYALVGPFNLLRVMLQNVPIRVPLQVFFVVRRNSLDLLL
jgi:hypothetical protein